MIDPSKPPAIEGSEKPELTLAMELAQFVREEMKHMESRISEQIRAAIQANSATVNRMNELEGAFKHLAVDLQQRALERVDKDYREAEARFKIAKEQKDNTLSTQEKIQVAQLFEDRQAAERRARAERWRALIQKWLEHAAGALVLAIVVPVGLAIVVVVLRFILSVLGIPLPDLIP